MDIALKGAGKVGRELKVRREKQDEVEVLHCHLVVEHLEVKREVIDQVCKQRRGWASEALYDELGAPRMRFDIRLKDLQLEAVGRITSEGHPADGKPKGERAAPAVLELGAARVTKLRFELVPNAALLSLRFTWDTAGDEAEDVSGILGRDCTIDVRLTGNPQQDLATPESPAVRGAARKGKRGRRVPVSGDLFPPASPA